jgi:hypothetical protein
MKITVASEPVASHFTSYDPGLISVPEANSVFVTANVADPVDPSPAIATVAAVRRVKSITSTIKFLFLNMSFSLIVEASFVN